MVRVTGSGARNSPAQRGATVIFDGRYIQDRYHGIGRYAFHLVRELAALSPDHSFEVLADPAAPNTRFDFASLEEMANVQVRQVSLPLFSLKEQVALPRVLRAYRSALYHTPYFAVPWLVPTDAQSIVTVHDCIFERDSRYMPKPWARIYYRLLMRASMRRSRLVAVPSKSTAADVRRFYGVPRHKLVITPEAADVAFRTIDDKQFLSQLRKAYNLPQSFVLAVGMRRPHKNFLTLVRAIGKLDDAALVFVGDADERFPDEVAATAQGLGNRVCFLGKIPEADLSGLYNLAAALACPSLVEGFGLPLVEAMASGTPLICSDIPVFREVAGDAALFVPARDEAAWASAVATVLESSVLQADLRRLGLERSRHFSWRAAAAPLLPHYTRLLSMVQP